MGHAYHQLYYHFAWSTHSRVPLIRRDWRPQLLKIINEEAKKCDGWPIRHNAMPDHVHLLVLSAAECHGQRFHRSRERCGSLSRE